MQKQNVYATEQLRYILLFQIQKSKNFTANALVRMRDGAGSHEPLLNALLMSNIFTIAGSIRHISPFWSTFK